MSTWVLCIGSIHSRLISNRLDKDLSVSDPNKTWLAAPNLSPAQIDADKIVERFALRMLAKLVPAYEFVTKQRSGMRIFVRLDISVFLEDGTPRFFVNEINNDHCSSMFQAGDEGYRNEILFQELANVLHFHTIQDRKLRRGGAQ